MTPADPSVQEANAEVEAWIRAPFLAPFTTSPSGSTHLGRRNIVLDIAPSEAEPLSLGFDHSCSPAVDVDEWLPVSSPPALAPCDGPVDPASASSPFATTLRCIASSTPPAVDVDFGALLPIESPKKRPVEDEPFAPSKRRYPDEAVIDAPSRLRDTQEAAIDGDRSSRLSWHYTADDELLGAKCDGVWFGTEELMRLCG